MNSEDKIRFAEIMAGVAENFNATLSKPGLSLRFEALREYSIQAVEKAAHAILRSRKYTSMPTVAEFLEYLGGSSTEDLACIEGVKVLNAVKQVGPYRSVVFDDAVTQAVIQHSFGGWEKINAELTMDNEKWFLKDFEKAYKAFSRQGIKLHGKLLGISDHQNMIRGYKVAEPKMIGEASKAMHVLSMAEDRTGDLEFHQLIGLPRMRTAENEIAELKCIER